MKPPAGPTMRTPMVIAVKKEKQYYEKKKNTDMIYLNNDTGFTETKNFTTLRPPIRWSKNHEALSRAEETRKHLKEFSTTC